MNKKILMVLVCFLAGCGSSDDPENLPSFARVTLLGGDGTNVDSALSGHGFSQPMPTLSSEELDLHLSGDAAFEMSFTSAPNSDHPDLDGIGPVFNNTNCNACHQRDGRSSSLSLSIGESELKLGSGAGIFLRMSIADANRDLECTSIPAIQTLDNAFCKVIPVPNFGDQLFHRGVVDAREDWNDTDTPQSFIGLANMIATFETHTVTYPDGETITLQKPKLFVRNPYDAPSEDETSISPTSELLQENVVFGPRNGMPIFGLGLLEAIPDESILALEDPLDQNQDGISGKANRVFDILKANNGDEYPVSIGRFGWKANAPTVRQQSLGALRGDMGITSGLFPDESIAGTALHTSYLSRTNMDDTGSDAGGNPEASDRLADEIVFYAETLAVPARRNTENKDVLAGSQLFETANCTGCHQPSFITTTDPLFKLGGKEAPKALLGQTIYPFSDMLLHDMGEKLADGRRDFLASGNEWKTRPLWGIGLTKTVNPNAGFLHDGRANTLEEAILWHGGEAEQSKLAFMAMDKSQRIQLISFLKAL